MYKCSTQNTGRSKIKFCYRANNCKSIHRKVRDKRWFPKEALKQKIFDELLPLVDHRSIQDWVITLIKQVDDGKLLGQRELFSAKNYMQIFQID